MRKQKIRFDHKVEIGNKREFEFEPIDLDMGSNLTKKDTLDKYSYESDNIILLYHSVCVLNNEIMRLNRKVYELQERE